MNRMTGALNLPDKVDFVILCTALGVFCERTPLDDKMRFLFRLYNSDGTGLVSRQDLTTLLDSILPEFPDTDERARLIKRSVEGTFEELCGNSDQQELGMEQSSPQHVHSALAARHCVQVLSLTVCCTLSFVWLVCPMHPRLGINLALACVSS
ncbi:unnamed protein product [Polarella glacialis]|uniref:EF-hand domain-containing protein n=1 Tax=Polarella glacialis TaxID=89957 RepID=A0A813FHV9_POLGL|nr:unnamed protein product [Polarella glacialis]CAE8737606.1 unnamed protein product [Polarella glacialis]